MKSQAYFKHYFDDLVFMLKLAGMWIPADDAKPTVRLAYYVYDILINTFMYIAGVPMLLMASLWNTNWIAGIRSSRDCSNFIACMLKVINWHVYRKELVGLMADMKTLELDYATSDDFRPMEIVAERLGRSRNWVRCYLLIALAIFICFSLTWFSLIIYGRPLVMTPSMPAPAVMPYEQNTRAYYVLWMILMSWPSGLATFAIVIIDSLFLSVVSCISTHFHILNGALKTIRARSIEIAKNRRDADLNAVMNQELVKCIRHLQFLYRKFDTIESVFSYQVGAQMFVSWGQVCFSLFFLTVKQCTTVGDAVYMVAILMQLFTYCAIGEQVTQASIEVRGALYDCQWEEADEKFKRALQITMIRVTKSVYISVSKLVRLNIGYFVTVLRAGYSLFALIQRIPYTTELENEE